MDQPQISSPDSDGIVVVSKSASQWSRLRTALATIVVAGLIPLIVNGYVSFNAYRRSLVDQKQTHLVRTRNFLILTRDELARTRESLDKGELDVKIVDGELVTPRMEWPTQVWYTARWNVDMLDMEPSLLQRLASVYDDIQHAKTIAETAQGSTTASNMMSQLVENMLDADRPPGTKTPKSQRKIPQETIIAVRLYDQAKNRLSGRLPDLLTAVNLEIDRLKADIDRR